jgi:hypothetical protein
MMHIPIVCSLYRISEFYKNSILHEKKRGTQFGGSKVGGAKTNIIPIEEKKKTKEPQRSEGIPSTKNSLLTIAIWSIEDILGFFIVLFSFRFPLTTFSAVMGFTRFRFSLYILSFDLMRSQMYVKMRVKHEDGTREFVLAIHVFTNRRQHTRESYVIDLWLLPVQSLHTNFIEIWIGCQKFAKWLTSAARFPFWCSQHPSEWVVSRKKTVRKVYLPRRIPCWPLPFDQSKISLVFSLYLSLFELRNLNEWRSTTYRSRSYPLLRPLSNKRKLRSIDKV